MRSSSKVQEKLDFITKIPDLKKAYFQPIQEKLNAFKRYEWNKYRIECNGTDIKIFVNGIMTSHVIDSTDAEGYIGLQHHGEKGKIYKFKNIRIKELN